MKRRIGLLLAVASFLSAVGVFAPSPASAVPTGEVCTGQGEATLSTGLGLPVLHGKNTAAFFYNDTISACVGGAKFFLSATGTVTGWCGQSEGKGTTYNGRDFVFTTGGGIMVITGELLGTAHVTANLLITNNSCTNKTATRFIVSYIVLKNDCDIISPETKGKIIGLVQTNVWVCV